MDLSGDRYSVRLTPRFGAGQSKGSPFPNLSFGPDQTDMQWDDGLDDAPADANTRSGGAASGRRETDYRYTSFQTPPRCL